MAGELTKAIRWVGPSTRLQHDIGVDVAGGGLFAVKPLRSMNGPVSRGVRVSRAEWGRGQHRAGTSAGAEGDQARLEPWAWLQRSWFQAGSLGGSGPPVLWHPDIAHPCRSTPRFRAVLNRRPVVSRSRGAAKRSGSALSQSEPARGLRLAFANLPLANPLRSHRRTRTCESHRPPDGSF